ncbi:hypothetical protein ACLQ2P_26320 [Actinomadura citrea]|uniref:hypothetical protein n=1 Tax=Actinomadura citrea TaxID=46158 RepID=UPI003CE4CABF
MDGESVVRAFRATGTAAKLAAYAVTDEASSNRPNRDHSENLENLWHAFLDAAGPFHDHPDIPEEIRETLDEWEAAKDPGRG